MPIVLKYSNSLNSFIRRLLIALPMVCCLLWAAPSCFANEDGLKAPVHFQSFRDVFGHIISVNGLFNDPEMILQLSNDCKVEYVNPGQKDGPQLAVLTVNLINHAGINELRGASNNGVYYVLQFTPTGMDLVGILEGNSWKLQTVNGRDAFVTTWHMSADEYVETIYDWNGSILKKTSSRTVKDAVNEN